MVALAGLTRDNDQGESQLLPLFSNEGFCNRLVPGAEIRGIVISIGVGVGALVGVGVGVSVGVNVGVGVGAVVGVGVGVGLSVGVGALVGVGVGRILVGVATENGVAYLAITASIGSCGLIS
jgi:hypothetical protein